MTADFVITMRGGNDTVTIEGNQAPDDVEIDTGDGDDTVMIKDLVIPDDLLILTGSGSDKVTITLGIEALKNA